MRVLLLVRYAEGRPIWTEAHISVKGLRRDLARALPSQVLRWLDTIPAESTLKPEEYRGPMNYALLVRDRD